MSEIKRPLEGIKVVELATFIAALWTARVPKRWMAPIPPVLCNMVIVGAEIAWFETNGFGSAFFAAWAWNGLTVGIGEAAACGLVGTLLLRVLPRIPALRDLMRQERLSEI